jgi:4-amino-4-deoxy-L-arabinose transferase-like glycosyltransferase
MRRHAAALLLLLMAVPVVWIRLRIAATPLGRDEGEYAYAGQLILDGVPPYVAAYNMKFPGTYYAYALVMALFGQTAWAIRVGLTLVNLATAYMLWRIGRRVLDDFTAAVSVAAFLVLSLDRWVQGTFAHATHFALLPALAGILLLLDCRSWSRMRQVMAAGALFGTAVLMKQHAVLFLPFALWLVWSGKHPEGRARFKPVLWLAMGSCLPIAVLSVVLALQGALGRCIFWTLGYAAQYVTAIAVADGWRAFLQGWRDITVATWPLWTFAACGFVALWFTRWPRGARLFVATLAAASFLAVCPGLYFRTHYFILLLPAAALCIGIGTTSLVQLAQLVTRPALAHAAALIVFASLVSAYVVGESPYLFSLDGPAIARDIYGANPFVEAPEIARYVRDHTSEEDTIAVIGSEPEIYFLADRRSATGYIYTYPLMEPQRYASSMQDEMMREIEAAHPKYVIAVLVGTSWLVRPESDNRILQWAERYTSACYEEVGVADIQPGGTTIRWDADATAYQPRSGSLVFTFKRRSEASCVASPR